MNVLAIIPARSGSRGVAHKNVKKLGNRPLMSYGIKAALDSCVDRVIVSTDSDDYAKVARSYGASVPFLRPAPLAEDVPSEFVVIHALEECEKIYRESYGAICLIQVTTPFLLGSDINKCLTALIRNETADSAITCSEVQDHPWWAFKMSDNGILTPFLDGVNTSGDWGVRQTLPKLVRPNGGCYAVKKTLLEKKKLIGDRCLGVLMPKIRSLDIDSEEDFLLCEGVLNHVYPSG